MKVALKILIGLAVVAVVATLTAVAALFVSAEQPAHAVGFTLLTVPDPQDKPLEVGVWYPTDSAPSLRVIGLSAQRVANDATVAGHDLPLIVMSHGNGGLFSSHSDTALALASAGFVAAAVTHTGDNARDDRYVGTPRWLVDRPRHIHLALDYLLNDWAAHRQLDRERVGAFGFSAGGFTALVSVGGVPDLARIATHCAQTTEFACALWKPLPSESIAPTAWVHDPRIKAAVVAAPGYGFAFEPNGLSGVASAVQLWNGATDRNVPYETNAAVVRRLLPTPPEYHDVPGAGHFSFLAPCPSWLLPMVCSDAEGFDRAAFHRDFNRSVIAFYRARFEVR